ncbi:MAG: hypothetical protein PQ975_07240 [Methanobacterium sp.]|jgi:hypothetical protein
MKFHRAIEYYLKKTLEELSHESTEGLESILHEIINLKESEIYEKMYNGSKEISSSNPHQLIENEKNQETHLIALGFKELGKFPFYIPPFSSLISVNNLNTMYALLLLTYYAHAEKKLGYEDLRNIYLSGLDHRIIHTLDKFDETLNVPKTDKEYLIALKNLHWENSDTKKLLKKLNYVKSLIGQQRFGRFGLRYEIGIQRIEDDSMIFIAGCSAVNHNRDKISKKDVINAYKTYFKLMKTDITQYKAIDKNYEPEISSSSKKSDNGYLVL